MTSAYTPPTDEARALAPPQDSVPSWVISLVVANQMLTLFFWWTAPSILVAIH